MYVSRNRDEYPSPSRRDSNSNFRYNEAQRQVGPSSGNRPDSNFGGPKVHESPDLTYLLNQKRHELDNLNSKMQVTDPKFYNMVKQYEKELGAFQRSRVEETSPVRYKSENPHINDKENEKLRRLQWIEQERLKRQGSAPNYQERENHSQVSQPERKSRHEENGRGYQSSIEERYNEEMGHRNGGYEHQTPQSHKKGPLITKGMEKVIGSVEFSGDHYSKNKHRDSEGDLFSKMGKHYHDNEAEKKRRYKEELDQIVKQKNTNQPNKERRQDNQKPNEFNKENRPSNAQEAEYGESQIDWNKKNRMADEVMISLLQRERGGGEYQGHQGNSGHHGNQGYQNQHPVNNQSEIYSIPASTPRRTPRKEYDHSPQQYRIERSSERPRDNFEQRRRELYYEDYEQRDRERVDKSVELDKKRKYKQELDAQMEERKRIQSAKPGAREEASRASVSESQDRRPTTSNNSKPSSEFSLFKAQEEAANRQKQKNWEMQKYAEELRKQMQEKEERKKEEKRKRAEEDAREEQKAQRLVQEAIEKNSGIQPSASQYQSNLSPYHSPYKNQRGSKSRSPSPPKKHEQQLPPYEYDQQRPVIDNLQTAQFPNPNEQQQHPNMSPYANPLMGNYFNPLQPYGNYPPMAGYPMYPGPYWMPGPMPMYGVPPYPDMMAYRNHMMQIMEERVKMERIAMQEKLKYQQDMNMNFPPSGDNKEFLAKSPNRAKGLQYNQTPSPVRKQPDFGDNNLQFTNVLNAPSATSHLYTSASHLYPQNDPLLQNSVLKNMMGNSRQFNDQYIEPDSLEQSYQQLNRSLPSTNLNFEIPAQQLEQSFNKDLNIFKVLHQKAFQLTPEKSGDISHVSPPPKSQANASPQNEKSQVVEESKEPTQERETVISIIPPSERGTANPSSGIHHYSTLLQYSQSIDNAVERTTVKTDADARKPRIESGLFYNLDNMGVMITPHGDPNIGTFGKIDTTPQVVYRLSPSLMTEGDNKVLSSNKEPSQIQEEDEESKYMEGSKNLREQTGRFGPPVGERMIKPLDRKELETAMSESDKSFEHGKTSVEAVEQKLEMKLVEMDEVRSLIVAEDDESAYYDEEAMKEFAESHDKILQEIRMDLRKNIKSDNTTNQRSERIAVVESSREGTEQELLDIVREAKKAVGIVEKAVPNQEVKRPVSPAARQNFRQNPSPLKLEKAVSLPEKKAAASPTEDVSPSKRQKIGGVAEKAVAMPDKKRPLSPVSRQALQESQSPLKSDSRPPVPANKKSPLKVETDMDLLGNRMEMNTPKSSDAFRTTKEGKRYRSPKTIDPFARAAVSLASVKSAPVIEEKRQVVESKSMGGKIDSSNEDRFNTQKSAKKSDLGEKNKEESIEEEISATEIEEEEKVFEQYDKEIKSQEIGSSVQGKDQWDILDILKDNQESEKHPSITDKKVSEDQKKKMLSEIDEQGDRTELETDGNRSRSMISIGKPKSPNVKRDRSRGLESELKEIEERLNRQPSRQGRPKTSQTEKSQVADNSRNENFGKSKASNFQDKSRDVIEIQTANWEDLRPEMALGSKVAVEEKSEGRVANEKRTKAILTKLEKLLDGWIGEDSEKENNAENNDDHSIETGKGGEKPISSSQPIFRPAGAGARRSLSNRYSEGDDY